MLASLSVSTASTVSKWSSHGGNFEETMSCNQHQTRGCCQQIQSLVLILVRGTNKSRVSVPHQNHWQPPALIHWFHNHQVVSVLLLINHMCQNHNDGSEEVTTSDVFLSLY